MALLVRLSCIERAKKGNACPYYWRQNARLMLLAVLAALGTIINAQDNEELPVDTSVYFPGGNPSTCGASCTVTVSSAAELAAALRNQSVEVAVLLHDITIGPEHFGTQGNAVIELNRDLMLHGGLPGATVTLGFNLTGLSSRSDEHWLRVNRGQLLFSNLRTGVGLFELGHESGHMPVTLVGVDLYGTVPGTEEYCQCTELAVMDSLIDVSRKEGGAVDVGVTPLEGLHALVQDELFLGETLKSNSVFTHNSWSFLDFNEAVFPQGMRFRMRNATLLFPQSPPPAAIPPEQHQPDCQSDMTASIRGRDYNGTRSYTRSGVPCAYWKNIQIAGLNFSDVGGNRCRNPADHSGAWCFVRRGERQLELDTVIPNFPFMWEYCAVPSCEVVRDETTAGCQNLEDNGAMYAGNVSVARNGQDCEPWSRSYPALYGNILGRECRNPFGQEEYVGCFVQGRWSRCNVEACSPSGSDTQIPTLTPPVGVPVGPDAGSFSELGVTLIVVIFVAVFVVVVAVGLLTWAFIRRRNALKLSANSVMTVGSPSRLKQGRLSRNITRQRSTGSSIAASGTTLPKSLASTEIRERLQQNDLMEDTTVLSNPVDMGHLELKRCLGSGSFAKVWQGVWLGADVACKVMVLKGRTVALRSHMLKGIEANSLRGITHPNVVQTYHVYKVLDRSMTQMEVDLDVDTEGVEVPNIAELWVVQELCNKGDLRSSVESICPLKEGSLKILLTTIKEVVLALSYLHHLGIVHGDLKCENVLLKSSTTEHGLVAKVADFGLARDLRGLDSYYASNISGDMKYLAPEVLEHNRVSPKMDTFSLGYLIYELASGQQTAMENVTLATHVQEVVHLRKRPSFPSTVLPALKALAEECWDHDPDKRPCDQLILRRLERMLAEYGSPSKQRSLKSFKDLTQTFGNMLASGVADDTVDGYLVPGLGSTMSPAESSRGGVTASIQNPLDPKFHISISMANQS